MQVGTADRGVAPVVGAILIFAAVIVTFAVYQGVVVPDQNQNVEIDHNQEIQADFITLRNEINRAGAIGTDQSVMLRMVTAYPDRLIARNPPPMSADIRTVRPTDTAGEAVPTVEIHGAVGTERGVADVWNGTTKSFETTTLEYVPEYFEYAEYPETRYEHSIVYNSFGPEQQLPITDQLLISDRSITIVTLAGDISWTESRARSLDIRTMSASSNTIHVEPAPGADTIELELPTRVTAPNEDRWQALFADEPAVTDVTIDEAAGTLRITLEDDGNGFDVRLAKVGIGPDVERPGPAYLVPVTPTPVLEGQSMVFEVRDRYNNPVAGTTVSVPGCGVSRADSAGRVAFTCSAGEYAASIPGIDHQPQSFTVTDPTVDVEDGVAVHWDLERIQSENLDRDGVDAVNCAEGTCVFDIVPDRTDELELLAKTDPPVVGAIVEFDVEHGAVSVDPSIALTEQIGTDAVARTTLSGITTDLTTMVEMSWGRVTDRLEVIVQVVEDRARFSWIEAQPSGPPGQPDQVTSVDVSFVLTGPTENVSVTVALYDGPNTAGSPFDQRTTNDIDAGTEQTMEFGVSPPRDAPITVEIIASEDGTVIEYCTGTMTDNNDTISTMHTTITCD